MMRRKTITISYQVVYQENKINIEIPPQLLASLGNIQRRGNKKRLMNQAIQTTYQYLIAAEEVAGDEAIVAAIDALARRWDTNRTSAAKFCVMFSYGMVFSAAEFNNRKEEGLK